ncbi:hypothetical protein ACFVIY_17720 [Streptomyces sp. NPDC127166]|uniref:hypothetical protein n=1 Tax=Streptomyces sp. NPDC127166 TaxID=3345380 RepID=UPI0036250A37
MSEDDDQQVQCWHIEPGTPCDWDNCRQPERLADGDVGTDPAEKSAAAATTTPARLTEVVSMNGLSPIDVDKPWHCRWPLACDMPYSSDPAHYMPLCKSCHVKFDS